MRDLLSKLDSIIKESALKDKSDLSAKQQALADLEADPVASSDPEISAAIKQRKADLEKEAQSKGMADSIELGDSFGISFSEDFEVGAEVIGFVEDGIVIELDDTAISHLEENGISFLDGELSESLRDPKQNPCWKGYKPVGTKKKNGKTVPNCVPKESLEEKEEKTHKGGTVVRTDKGLKHYAKYDDDNDDNFDHDKLQKGFVNKMDRELDVKFSREKKFGGGLNVDEAEYQGRDVPLGKKMAGDVKKYKVYVKNPQGNVVKVNFGDKKMRIKKSNPERRKSFRARHNCDNPGPRHKARYWSCRNW